MKSILVCVLCLPLPSLHVIIAFKYLRDELYKRWMALDLVQSVCPPFIIGTGKNMGTLFLYFLYSWPKRSTRAGSSKIITASTVYKVRTELNRRRPTLCMCEKNEGRHNIVYYSYVDWSTSKEEWGGRSGDSGGGGESLPGEKEGNTSLHTNLPTTSADIHTKRYSRWK